VTDGRDGRALVPGDGAQAGVDVGRDGKPDVPGDATTPPPLDGRGPDVARTDPPPIGPGADPDKQSTPDGQKVPDPLAKTDPQRPLELPPSDNKSPPPGPGFLEGRWKAGEGLVDRATGQPLDLSFNFDKQGKGEVTLRRADGSTCKGAVAGTMNGGKLSIAGSDRIPCSNGGAYAAPKIECTKAAGARTQCFGVNSDGSKYYMGIGRES
jgi:hypothetical protein